MNETLQIALADILTKAVSTVETAGVFLKAEMPEVVRQLLAWKFAVSLIGFCLPYVAILIAGCVFARALKKPNIPCSYGGTKWGDAKGACLIVPCVFTGIMLLASMCSCFEGPCLDWLQITVAPRIFLIEYASQLVK
jgi:hypothetical protein